LYGKFIETIQEFEFSISVHPSIDEEALYKIAKKVEKKSTRNREFILPQYQRPVVFDHWLNRK